MVSTLDQPTLDGSNSLDMKILTSSMKEERPWMSQVDMIEKIEIS
jgi:hypothetical protein